ncbi:hypothetical protein GCM10008967_03350 [Bacillus carboniphilus]|uniref:M23ase beta-sheet core domain-containing protein n=1 Tax=Bacillus carboniphilus TaxID=86663 RepID=A0ABN0VSB8_9BACI
MFIRPTDVTRVTQGFRRSNQGSHFGVDFAAPGTHEIVAVADGTVTRSYRSASYGEVIFIVHSIDGQTWETVYAHLRTGSRRVQTGDRVRQGQVIGIMGSTGNSTGQHLHFELHRGRWNINKTNAVSPLPYLDDAPVQSPPAPAPSPSPTPVTGESYIVLPANSDSWRVYPLGVAPVVGNEKGLLNPQKFGGLTYRILGKTQDHVYIIETADFGRVQIYGHPSTGARVTSQPQSPQPTPQPTPRPTPPPTSSRERRLILPSASTSWRVYPLNVAPVVGNAIGFLNPSKFGGLTYTILGNPQKDVYTIETRDFGRVNIYAAPSTGARIQ